MQRKTIDVLACPSCLSGLAVTADGGGEIDEGMLTCQLEGLQFPVVSGIPLLVRPGSVERVSAFEASFPEVWTRDGWGASDEEYLLNLPARDVTRRHSEEWRLKARSMDALFRALDRARPKSVIDLGCGMGWLAHHLARRGHEVYAVDIVRDKRLGLGAADRYVNRGPFFERVWGELERPPFRDSCADAVICNASLHYALDLSAVLREIARIMRPGGIFILLNSPVHHDESSAVRAQDDFRRRLRRLGAVDGVASVYRHFTRDALEGAVRSIIGPVEEEPFQPGKWFLLRRRAKQFALRMELASFPILCARKT